MDINNRNGLGVKIRETIVPRPKATNQVEQFSLSAFGSREGKILIQFEVPPELPLRVTLFVFIYLFTLFISIIRIQHTND